MAQFKTLPQGLAYIETLHPQTMALGLERVSQVADRLQLRHFNCPVVTIGGTNGKGSCAAFLTAILQAQGYRVGTYTSPHLIQFQERIALQSQPVSEASLLEAFQVVEHARDNIPLTYFEFTTLAALQIFRQQPLDALILEVGLGGRLDAVNIVEPDLSIVTSIALDHMAWLGDTREAIAYEKAGIFRPDKPAICGDPDPPATLLQYAQQIQAQLFVANRDFTWHKNATSWNWQTHTEQWDNLPLPQLHIMNAATALMALTCLKPRLNIEYAALQQGLREAYLPGRFQCFTQPRSIILDVAHNPAATILLAERLQSTPITGKTLAVVGMLADKDIAGTLKPLLSVVDAWFLSTLPESRGAKAIALATQLSSLGVNHYDQYESVLTAFDQAVANCGPTDRIIVFGSFHTVGPILSRLRE
ncbi:MAG: bifunctional tetrahydrofolate synthase/dihydrofolate synthase [Gammaproteobacteria bacterium]